jgi:hypothetical protein
MVLENLEGKRGRTEGRTHPMNERAIVIFEFDDKKVKGASEEREKKGKVTMDGRDELHLRCALPFQSPTRPMWVQSSSQRQLEVVHKYMPSTMFIRTNGKKRKEKQKQKEGVSNSGIILCVYKQMEGPSKKQV